MRFPGPHPFQDALSDDATTALWKEPTVLPQPPELARQYRRLSLRDVDLGFSGRQHPGNPIHHAIAALSPGDPLQVGASAQRWELLDDNGTAVGQLAASFQTPADTRRATATVQAIVHWNREHSEPRYRDRYRCDFWEVVVPELAFDIA